MNKVIVIGCPGAGKSTFARKLSAKTNLPLHYLDMMWHLPDQTTVGRERFDEKLRDILKDDKWIIDGNYLRTLPMRLEHCDTVVVFDIPTDICMEGTLSRIGKPREDMPWMATEMDPEFSQWILDFPKDQTPIIEEMLSSCKRNTDIIRFRSRAEADAFIESLECNFDMIETERLVMRHWRVEDAPALYKYASDNRVSELALWPIHTSVEMSREVIEKIFMPNPYCFAIVLKESYEPVGCLGLVPVGDEHHETAAAEREVGYWIGWKRRVRLTPSGTRD